MRNPNPSISDFHVVARLSGEHDVRLDVFALDGQQVTFRQWTGVKEVKDRIGDLHTGMYIFRLRVEDDILHFRVVKVD